MHPVIQYWNMLQVPATSSYGFGKNEDRGLYTIHIHQNLYLILVIFEHSPLHVTFVFW